MKKPPNGGFMAIAGLTACEAVQGARSIDQQEGRESATHPGACGPWPSYALRREQAEATEQGRTPLHQALPAVIDGCRGIAPVMQCMPHIETLLQDAGLEIFKFRSTFTTIHERPPVLGGLVLNDSRWIA